MPYQTESNDSNYVSSTMSPLREYMLPNAIIDYFCWFSAETWNIYFDMVRERNCIYNFTFMMFI
jgi:hypothetical protein